MDHGGRVITQVEETASPNPWLAGNFAPVDQEVTLTDLTVRGELPEALRGRFLRIGPNPQGAIRLEVRKPESGQALMMNYITFVRPQVNAFNSNRGPGVTGIWLKGYDDQSPVQMISIISADVEGGNEVAIRLEQADHNHIEIAALPGSGTGISLDADSQFNTIVSAHDRVRVSDSDHTYNLFSGHFDSIDGGRLRGLVWGRQERRWSLSLGGFGVVSSGNGYLWHDDTSDQWRVSRAAPTPAARRHPRERRS